MPAQPGRTGIKQQGRKPVFQPWKIPDLPAPGLPVAGYKKGWKYDFPSFFLTITLRQAHGDNNDLVCIMLIECQAERIEAFVKHLSISSG